MRCYWQNNGQFVNCPYEIQIKFCAVLKQYSLFIH
nr:MAG TPA: hypothetical protein [Caudoviricetes sp.]